MRRRLLERINESRALPRRDIVLVAGMPKSGTTAVAKLLGMAAGLEVCSDPFYRLDRIDSTFRERLFAGHLSLETLWRRHRHIFRGDVVKDPNFPLLLPQLAAMFPNAPVVMVIRDPHENIRSILDRLSLPGVPDGVDLQSHLPSATWVNVLTGRLPPVPGDDYVAVLANRWRQSAEAFIRFKERGILVRYEDFCKDKVAFIETLATRLAIPPLHDISAHVDRQFQPKGKRGTNLRLFFGDAGFKKIDVITGDLRRHVAYGTI